MIYLTSKIREPLAIRQRDGSVKDLEPLGSDSFDVERDDARVATLVATSVVVMDTNKSDARRSAAEAEVPVVTAA